MIGNYLYRCSFLHFIFWVALNREKRRHNWRLFNLLYWYLLLLDIDWYRAISAIDWLSFDPFWFLIEAVKAIVVLMQECFLWWPSNVKLGNFAPLLRIARRKTVKMRGLLLVRQVKECCSGPLMRLLIDKDDILHVLKSLCAKMLAHNFGLSTLFRSR